MNSCDKHRKRQSVRRRRAAARWFHRNSGEGRMVLDHLQPMGQPANAPGAGRGTWTCCCHRSGARAIGSGRDRRVRVWALEARRALPHRLAGCLTRCSSAVADNGADLDGGSRPHPRGPPPGSTRAGVAPSRPCILFGSARDPCKAPEASKSCPELLLK